MASQVRGSKLRSHDNIPRNNANKQSRKKGSLFNRIVMSRSVKVLLDICIFRDPDDQIFADDMLLLGSRVICLTREVQPDALIMLNAVTDYELW